MLIKMDIQSKKKKRGKAESWNKNYLCNTTFNRGRNMGSDKLRNTYVVNHLGFSPSIKNKQTQHLKNKSSFYFTLTLSQFKTTLINMV